MPKVETKDECSLLLYLETRCVDYGGILDTRHMNDEDVAILERWKEEGFIDYGRVAFKTIPEAPGCRHWTEWVALSEEAWKEAFAQRIARFTRVYSKRRWMTTKEYQNS